MPVRAAPTPGVIADSDAFKIRRVVLDAGEKIHVAANEQPRLLSVVSGKVTALVDGKPAPQGALPRGENVLLPYGKAFTFAADTTAIVLVTEDFA